MWLDSDYIRQLNKPYVNGMTLSEEILSLKCCQPLELLIYFGKRFKSFHKFTIGSIGQSAVMLTVPTKKFAALANTVKVRSAQVQFHPCLNHYLIWMTVAFHHFDLQTPYYLYWKILTPSKSMWKVQEAGKILRVGFAFSRCPIYIGTPHLKGEKLSKNSSWEFENALETLFNYWVDPDESFCPESSRTRWHCNHFLKKWSQTKFDTTLGMKTPVLSQTSDVQIFSGCTIFKFELFCLKESSFINTPSPHKSSPRRGLKKGFITK